MAESGCPDPDRSSPSPGESRSSSTRSSGSVSAKGGQSISPERWPWFHEWTSSFSSARDRIRMPLGGGDFRAERNVDEPAPVAVSPFPAKRPIP